MVRVLKTQTVQSIGYILHGGSDDYFPAKQKAPETLDLQGFPVLLKTGDERIELPPKVLETPIIPFDQSPI